MHSDGLQYITISRSRKDNSNGRFAYRDVGKGREHDCMDAGGRAMHGAIAEERKLCCYLDFLLGCKLNLLLK